jgi:hypothetical protein
MQVQLEIAKAQAEIAKLQAEAMELQTRAGLNQAKTQTEAIQPEVQAAEVMLKGIYQTPEAEVQAEFDRRVQMAELMVAAEDVQSNERITQMQLQGKDRDSARKHASDMAKAQANVAASEVKARGQVEAARAKPQPKPLQ